MGFLTPIPPTEDPFLATLHTEDTPHLLGEDSQLRKKPHPSDAQVPWVEKRFGSFTRLLDSSMNRQESRMGSDLEARYHLHLLNYVIRAILTGHQTPLPPGPALPPGPNLPLPSAPTHILEGVHGDDDLVG